MKILFYYNIYNLVKDPPYVNVFESLKIALEAERFCEELARSKGHEYATSISGAVNNINIMARKDFVFTDFWRTSYDNAYSELLDLVDCVVIIPSLKSASNITTIDRNAALLKGCSVFTFSHFFAGDETMLANHLIKYNRSRENKILRSIPNQMRGSRRK